MLLKSFLFWNPFQKIHNLLHVYNFFFIVEKGPYLRFWEANNAPANSADVYLMSKIYLERKKDKIHCTVSTYMKTGIALH